MIQFIHKLLFKSAVAKKEYLQRQHGFGIKHIDKHALKVLKRLDQSGCEAYLVGGVLRDFMLGMPSKDCDVVTNVKPKKITQVISNSIMIGKRFRIVHARFGRDYVEVSTFRAKPRHKRASETLGILKRDNVYGTIEEDVMRRDFTINALYYRFKDHVLIDYVGGMDDMKARRLRSIGDPMVRFQEDPVRIIRAIRFAAKLSLTMSDDIISAINAHKDLLKEVSGQRMFTEIVKLYYCGQSEAVHEMMVQHGLMEVIFPELMRNRVKDKALPLIRVMTETVDKRYALNKKLSVVYLFAAIYWPYLESMMARKRMRHFSISVVNELFSKLTLELPLKVKEGMVEIWKNQYLFRQQDSAPGALLRSKRLRASYDLLCQRAKVDERAAPIALYWSDHVGT